MATYNTAFGSLPGYNEMLGTTNTTGGGQQQTYDPQRQQRQQQQPAQTFAQLQRQGMARPPAPTAPQAQSFQQFGGSQQGQQMRQQLQQQLQQFGQAPSRFDTQAFQQMRSAQQANLQSEFQEQQRQLNEDLARRGLSASTIGAAGLGRLAGAQSRALADIDAQLLQRAAETQAADRAQLLAAGQGLAELAGAQDLQQFEANRVAQAAEFEQGLRGAEFGQRQFEFGGQQALQAAQAEQAAGQFGEELGLRFGELTGQIGGQQTLSAQQQAEQRRQFDIRQALEQQLGLGGLDIQRGELTLEQQRLQQQAADASAERQLREALQTRELSAQEQQQLRDITARRDLQTQQIAEEARQFGLQLDEQQKARVQQGGFTAQELALEARRVDNQASQFGQQLTAQERQNQALNALEERKLNEDVNFRAQQLGLNRNELDMRAAQIKEDQRLRGVELTNDQAYRTAELNLRTSQVQNEFLRSGQQITLEEARLQAQRDLSAADNAAQMARLERQLGSQATLQREEIQARASESALERRLREQLGLTEATGQVYTVGPGGQLVAGGDTLAAQLQRAQLTGTLGGQATLARLQQSLQEAQAMSEITGQQYIVDQQGRATSALRPTEAARRFNLEQSLRQALGMSELSGMLYNPLTGGEGVGAQQSFFQTMGRQEMDLRRELGLSELFGMRFSAGANQFIEQDRATVGARQAQAQQDIARNQLFVELLDRLRQLIK